MKPINFNLEVSRTATILGKQRGFTNKEIFKWRRMLCENAKEVIINTRYYKIYKRPPKRKLQADK
jgi:hypothetical protein